MVKQTACRFGSARYFLTGGLGGGRGLGDFRFLVEQASHLSPFFVQTSRRRRSWGTASLDVPEPTHFVGHDRVFGSTEMTFSSLIFSSL